MKNIIVRKYIKRSILQAAIIGALYLSIYVILSLNGQYQPRPTGKFRMNGGAGLAYMDAMTWEPKWLVLYKWAGVDRKNNTDANTGGYIFYPLIYLDRLYWHETKIMGRDIGG